MPKLSQTSQIKYSIEQDIIWDFKKSKIDKMILKQSSEKLENRQNEPLDSKNHQIGIDKIRLKWSKIDKASGKRKHIKNEQIVQKLLNFANINRNLQK